MKISRYGIAWVFFGMGFGTGITLATRGLTALANAYFNPQPSAFLVMGIISGGIWVVCAVLNWRRHATAIANGKIAHAFLFGLAPVL